MKNHENFKYKEKGKKKRKGKAQEEFECLIEFPGGYKVKKYFAKDNDVLKFINDLRKDFKDNR